MDMTPIAANAFAGLLERATGQQLVAGRRWRIEAALKPVMRANGIDTLDRLAIEIGRNRTSQLATTVVEALLNNETSFFRDAAACGESFEAAMVTLTATRAAQGVRRLRVWSAGCSTGQEIYSLAIGFDRTDTLDGWDITLLGTDVSHEALGQARQGLYNQMEAQRGLSIRDLIGYFDQEGDNWRFRPGVRPRMSFLQHNLFSPPPGVGFDIILCRNVLIYFEPDKRRQVLAGLAEAIAPDGWLMLGAGETVLGAGDDFEAERRLRGVYRRRTMRDKAGGDARSG